MNASMTWGRPAPADPPRQVPWLGGTDHRTQQDVYSTTPRMEPPISDLLGEATGGGTYEALLPRSEVRDLSGLECRFVDLPTLIHLKRAAGRPKDLERIAELEALRQERP